MGCNADELRQAASHTTCTAQLCLPAQLPCGRFNSLEPSAVQCKAAGPACSSTPSIFLNPDSAGDGAAPSLLRRRSSRRAPRVADDGNAAAEPPRRWSDYTVFFEFPEPTELQPPLIQLNDVSFKYPGREDFGLKVSPPGRPGGWLCEGCPAACEEKWLLELKSLGHGWGLTVHVCSQQLHYFLLHASWLHKAKPRRQACRGVWSVGSAVQLNASAWMSTEQCLR